MARTMRAFVITGPRAGSVVEVDRPLGGTGQVVIDIERVGLCGTDVELLSGEMAYLATGDAVYPLRPGHEWVGRVASVGSGVDPAWIGRRTTGDTMLGCGRCARCGGGRQHLCAERFEVGIRRGWPGALAEQLLLPQTALRPLPDDLDVATGALVEPGGNAWRAVEATSLATGHRLLIVGAGTIGLLCGLIGRARGLTVTMAGRSDRSIQFARSLGFDTVASASMALDARFDAAIDASTDGASPAAILEHVDPGGRVVYIGLAGGPSPIDTRRLVLGDITAIGILSASPGLGGVIAMMTSGAIDPRSLVAAVVRLEDVGSVLAGTRDAAWGGGPKIQVDPRS